MAETITINIVKVNDKELDEMERVIYAAAYVAKLLRPHEGPPMPPMHRELNGKTLPSSAALTAAAWAVLIYRADQNEP